MKVKIFSVVLLFLICTAVILNTVMLTKTINGFTERISTLEINESEVSSAESAARAAYEDFKASETFMSLTVNHNDLTAIEELFAEMIGYLSIADADGARVAKSRLIDALSHLRRLSGVNIDSIV